MAMVSKSPWVVCYDGAGCGGCSLEAEVCFKPFYECGNRGMVAVDNPKHGDILLVTGAVNGQNEDVIKQLYDQMPEPKVVLAVGDCACDGGVFCEAGNISGGIGAAVPVDVSVPGCATEPGKIAEALDAAAELLDAKATERMVKPDEEVDG